MDADTAALIAQLARDDLEEALLGAKGKNRADAPLSDEEYAYQLQSESFQDFLQVSGDAVYARGLEAALITDAAYLEAAMAAEEAAVQDRRAAEIASRGEELPPQTAAQTLLENPTFVMHPEPPTATPIAQLGEMPSLRMIYPPNNIQEDLDPPADHPLEEYLDWGQNASVLADTISNSTPAFHDSSLGAGPSVDRNKLVQCTICDDSLTYNKALHTPCDHDYCGECVVNLVESFTRDESLFPLRCCKQPILISDIDDFVSSTLRALFLKKHVEFSVLSKDRLYCFEPTCSTFLGSTEGIEVIGIICPTCARSTCPRCKQAEHTGEDCIENAGSIAVRALAHEQGWQTCPKCHMLVELSIGCYHMTCRCRAEFCYLCAVPWKNCQCPQWEEIRLLEAAQQMVANELAEQVDVAQAPEEIPPEVVVQRVERRVQALRNEHECHYHVWRQQRGDGVCPICNTYYNQFLKICKNCSTLACARCAQNRL